MWEARLMGHRQPALAVGQGSAIIPRPQPDGQCPRAAFPQKGAPQTPVGTTPPEDSLRRATVPDRRRALEASGAAGRVEVELLRREIAGVTVP